ncbi:MAG: hypothetical protein KA941_02540 [Flavobacteriales bacterium]|nr:hypothetical protein [Flavobacteriales bacterium]
MLDLGEPLVDWRAKEARLKAYWKRRDAEFALALNTLRPETKRLVRSMAIHYADDHYMARVLAPGFTLAYERRVVGRLAPELKRWRTQVRQLFVDGRLPLLKAEQAELRYPYDDELAAVALRFSLEPLSPEARQVLRAVLRPPVNALNFSVVLWPHFPFSMYGKASAATVLELEAWQHKLKDQVCWDTLGPRARKVLNEVLGA